MKTNQSTDLFPYKPKGFNLQTSLFIFGKPNQLGIIITLASTKKAEKKRDPSSPFSFLYSYPDEYRKIRAYISLDRLFFREISFLFSLSGKDLFVQIRGCFLIPRIFTAQRNFIRVCVSVCCDTRRRTRERKRNNWPEPNISKKIKRKSVKKENVSLFG